MPQRTSLADADCAIAQALDVVGDWWTLLIVRDTARGCTVSTRSSTSWACPARS